GARARKPPRRRSRPERSTGANAALVPRRDGHRRAARRAAECAPEHPRRRPVSTARRSRAERRPPTARRSLGGCGRTPPAPGYRRSSPARERDGAQRSRRRARRRATPPGRSVRPRSPSIVLDPSLQTLLQTLGCTKNQAFYGLLGAAQHGADLLVAKALEPAEQEGGALLLG